MIVADGSLVVPGDAGLALGSLVHNVGLIFPLEKIIRRFKRNIAKRRLGVLAGHGAPFQIGIDIRRVAHGPEFGFAVKDLSRGDGLRLPCRFVSQVILGRIEIQVFLIGGQPFSRYAVHVLTGLIALISMASGLCLLLLNQGYSDSTSRASASCDL